MFWMRNGKLFMRVFRNGEDANVGNGDDEGKGIEYVHDMCCKNYFLRLEGEQSSSLLKLCSSSYLWIGMRNKWWTNKKIRKNHRDKEAWGVEWKIGKNKTGINRVTHKWVNWKIKNRTKWEMKIWFLYSHVWFVFSKERAMN
jgi:hypothetical protein